MMRRIAAVILLSWQLFASVQCQVGKSPVSQFNPTILQDSRDLPKVDGTFGFLYRTEDGIAHAAKGNSDGVIQGRFSYTDPTGLKVNYNYQAGSRFTPGYSYENDGQPEDDGQYREEQYGERRQQPQPQYRPLPQQPPRPAPVANSNDYYPDPSRNDVYARSNNRARY